VCVLGEGSLTSNQVNKNVGKVRVVTRTNTKLVWYEVSDCFSEVLLFLDLINNYLDKHHKWQWVSASYNGFDAWREECWSRYWYNRVTSPASGSPAKWALQSEQLRSDFDELRSQK
jgi:hypothetical protein